MTIARELLQEHFAQSLTEASISASDLIARLEKIFRRDHGNVDHNFYDLSSTEISLEFPETHLLQGVERRGSEDILTTGFEKYVLASTGWQVSGTELGYKSGSDTPIVYIALERPEEMDQSEVPNFRYVYHVAPIHLESSILSKGLIPRKRDDDSYGSIKYSDPRVYFWITDDMNSIKKHTEGFARENKQFGNYTIFQIDTSKVPGLELFNDNNVLGSSRESAYGKVKVPAAAIRVLRKIDISNPQRSSRRRRPGGPPRGYPGWDR